MDVFQRALATAKPIPLGRPLSNFDSCKQTLTVNRNTSNGQVSGWAVSQFCPFLSNQQWKTHRVRKGLFPNFDPFAKSTAKNIPNLVASGYFPNFECFLCQIDGKNTSNSAFSKFWARFVQSTVKTQWTLSTVDTFSLSIFGGTLSKFKGVLSNQQPSSSVEWEPLRILSAFCWINSEGTLIRSSAFLQIKSQDFYKICALFVRSAK